MIYERFRAFKFRAKKFKKSNQLRLIMPYNPNSCPVHPEMDTQSVLRLVADAFNRHITSYHLHDECCGGTRQPGCFTAFEQLVHDGQKPPFLLINCPDSRLANLFGSQNPGLYFAAAPIAAHVPAELPVMRFARTRAPWLMHPAKCFAALCGGNDALHFWANVEYAIRVLEVKTVIIMGHSECGGLNAATNGNGVGGYVGLYVDQLSPVVKAVLRKNPQLNGQALKDEVYRENVRSSVRNMEDYIDTLSPRTQPKVVGLLWDMKRPALLSFDREVHEGKNDFVPIAGPSYSV